MPNVFNIARRLFTSACVNDSPKNFTIPLISGCNPTMWRSSVLLPQPDPPMMKKISPWATVKLTSFRTTLPSYPAWTCSTSIAGVTRIAPVPFTFESNAGGTLAPLGERFSFITVCPSPAQHVEHDRENRVRHDDEQNRGDHRRRGGATDPGGASLRLQPAQATRETNQHAERHGL